MRFAVYIVLALIPLIEIAILVKVGGWIGLWWTLGLVLLMAAGGTYVFNRQGFAMMNRVVETMAQGKPPVGAVIDGAFLMVAGLLLITPGLMTDVLGLLLLIPPLRHRIAAYTVRRVLRTATVRTATYRQEQARWTDAETGPQAGPGHSNGHTATPTGTDGPVIDGEFERLDERNLDQRRRTAEQARRDGTSPPPPRG
jgi:UPF0716 protein FxsA